MEILYAVCTDPWEHSHEKDILHFPQITFQNLQAQTVFTCAQRTKMSVQFRVL